MSIKLFKKGGRGKKLCGGCKKYVAARTHKCKCGYVFHKLPHIANTCSVKENKKDILYAIFAKSGIQTSVDTVVRAAKSDYDISVSYAYVVMMRKEFCKEYNCNIKDARTHRDVPERNMDTQYTEQDFLYLLRFRQQYHVPFDAIRELGTRFGSVKLDAAIQHLDLAVQIVAA
jgi:hypothetical protein